MAYMNQPSWDPIRAICPNNPIIGYLDFIDYYLVSLILGIIILIIIHNKIISKENTYNLNK